MDEFVKAKLLEWNLAELLPAFEAQQIDQDCFFLLGGDSLISLTPLLGPRLKFQRQLKRLLEIGTNMVGYLSGATTEYPYVLMLGEEHQCSQAFVIINGTAMEHPSLLGAVDGKAFFVFDVTYPKPCAQVWEFIQTVIFNIPGHESNAIKLMRAQLAVI